MSAVNTLQRTASMEDRSPLGPEPERPERPEGEAPQTESEAAQRGPEPESSAAGVPTQVLVDLLDAVCATDDRAQTHFVEALPPGTARELRLACRRAQRLVDEHLPFAGVWLNGYRSEAEAGAELASALLRIGRLWPRCRSLKVASRPGPHFRGALREAAAAGPLRSVTSFRLRVLRPPSYYGSSASDLGDYWSLTGRRRSGAGGDSGGDRLDGRRAAGDADAESTASGESSAELPRGSPPHLTGDDVDALLALLPNLQSLDVDPDYGALAAGAAAIGGGADFLASLAAATHLRRLRIPADMYQDEAIAELRGLTRLDLTPAAFAEEDDDDDGGGRVAVAVGLRPGALGLFNPAAPKAPPCGLQGLTSLVELSAEARMFRPGGRRSIAAAATASACAGTLIGLPPNLRLLLLTCEYLDLNKLNTQPTEAVADAAAAEAGPSGAGPDYFGGPAGIVAAFHELMRPVARLPSSASVKFSGSLELDLAQRSLVLGRIASPAHLSGLVRYFEAAGGLQQVAVEELTFPADATWGRGRTTRSQLAPEIEHLRLFATHAAAAAAGGSSQPAQHQQQAPLVVRRAVAGFKAADSLRTFLRDVGQVRVLLLHAHGSNDSYEFLLFVRGLGEQMAATSAAVGSGCVPPEALHVSGYIGRSSSGLEYSLATWPRLRGVMAQISFEERKSDWQSSRYGHGRRRDRSRAYYAHEYIPPPGPDDYAKALRVSYNKVRDADGWCAVAVRTRFIEEVVAGLAEEAAAGRIPARVVKSSGKWVLMAASDAAMRVAVEMVTGT